MSARVALAHGASRSRPDSGARREGQGGLTFTRAPYIVAAYSVAGPEEGRGPLGPRFDLLVPDYEWGESSFERSEQKFLRRALDGALRAAGLSAHDIDAHFGGDLLDEMTVHSLTVREDGIPFVGLFSACATCGSGLGLASSFIAGGGMRRTLVSVSSHYYTAERQFRFPTELGVQRKPTNQRTATGAVAFVLSGDSAWDGEGSNGAPEPGEIGFGRLAAGGGAAGASFARVTHFTAGRVRDLGVKDTNNLGAAEAPAAADTLLRHFAQTGRRAEDYDLVLTGDLAGVGLPLAQEICKDQGLDLGSRWQDAGIMLYGPGQDADAGGSGAACCALVLAAEVLPRLVRGEWGRVLFVATGSLHSKTSYEQGESIPVVAHAVELTGPSARPLGEEAGD